MVCTVVICTVTLFITHLLNPFLLILISTPIWSNSPSPASYHSRLVIWFDRYYQGKRWKCFFFTWIWGSKLQNIIYSFIYFQDGRLTREEILDKFDLFVGSQATDFGEALTRHDEFWWVQGYKLFVSWTDSVSFTCVDVYKHIYILNCWTVWTKWNPVLIVDIHREVEWLTITNATVETYL